MKLSKVLAATCGCLILSVSAARSQTARTDPIQEVKPSVSQIVLTVSDIKDASLTKMPLDLRAVFENGTWIAGTGLLINDDSEILTAAHVALGIQEVSKKLSDAGIHSELGVAFAGSNIDSPAMKVRSHTLTLGAQIIGIDPDYDVAVIHTGTNPEGIGSRMNGIYNLARPKPLKFTLVKPRDGQEVFACGFPVGSRDLVTTSGTIASAEGFQPLLTAKQNGIKSPVDVYKVDIRISPGNSGGPVLRKSDGAIVGILVESVNGGGYAIAVPSKEVTDSLTKHGIKWQAVSN